MNFQIVQKPLPYQQIIDMAHEMKPGDCVENLPAKLAKTLVDELTELYGQGSCVFAHRGNKQAWTVWRKK
tara:strand:+ start:1548 stop:1757 length:210 start_codon:yes stop_codon:yes gene_type:complete